MKPGYVYLLGDSSQNLYKIGMTTKPIEERLKELQTGNATELHLCAYHETDYPRRVESMLHNRFKNKNILNEWFELDSKDISSFNDTCNGIEEIISIMKDNVFFTKDL